MLKPYFFTITAISILCLLLFNSSGFAENNRMKHFENGQATELASMNLEGVNAFVKDIIFSNDPESPITCGLFRMEKGAPLQYTYTFDEAKIIVEGEMTISEEGGETVTAKAGDMLYFEEGAKITFTSASSGLGFYCGQRTAEEL